MTAVRVCLVALSVTAACSRQRPARTTDSARSSDTVASSTAAPAVTPQPRPAPNAPAADSTPKATVPEPRVLPSETVLTGKVVAGGLAASPVTSLQVEGGKPTSLAGPLEPELRRLGGATVWVTGAPGRGAPNASFTVSRYEIVSIDGAKPFVGHVLTRDGQPVLAMERDTVSLVSAAVALTGKVGAKVWIVGRRTGNDLTPQTYGVIREP